MQMVVTTFTGGATATANAVTVSNVVVPAGAVLYAGFGARDGTDPSDITVSSFVYNTSESLSIVGSLLTPSGTNTMGGIYRLTNPSAGTHDVVLTISESLAGGGGLCCIVAVVQFIDTVLLNDTVQSATSASGTAVSLGITKLTNSQTLAWAVQRNTNNSLTVTSPTIELATVVSNVTPGAQVVRLSLWTRSASGAGATLPHAGTISSSQGWLIFGVNLNPNNSHAGTRGGVLNSFTGDFLVK